MEDTKVFGKKLRTRVVGGDLPPTPCTNGVNICQWCASSIFNSRLPQTYSKTFYENISNCILFLALFELGTAQLYLYQGTSIWVVTIVTGWHNVIILTDNQEMRHSIGQRKDGNLQTQLAYNFDRNCGNFGSNGQLMKKSTFHPRYSQTKTRGVSSMSNSDY